MELAIRSILSGRTESGALGRPGIPAAPPAPPYPRGSGANGDRFRLPLVGSAVHLPQDPPHLSKRLFPTSLFPLRRRSAHFTGWPASGRSACYDWSEGLSIIISGQDLVGCCPSLPPRLRPMINAPPSRPMCTLPLVCRLVCQHSRAGFVGCPNLLAGSILHPSLLLCPHPPGPKKHHDCSEGLSVILVGGAWLLQTCPC